MAQFLFFGIRAKNSGLRAWKRVLSLGSRIYEWGGACFRI